ncbi:cytochrome P450 [Streptomyces hygroscopicus]|uniref:cytochrome P450 n=1 Tax=Streptomyces hygroscopicus TaxID=1912 RepID=UPI001FCBB944|nr:cytochrome P450 [Streptomyces hygroscopicus]BDH15335.1 cytochrome P450 [Streptomyces hygroscopicus]
MSSPQAQGLVELPDSHRGAITLGDPAYHRDPADVFSELRRAYGPVAPVLLDGQVPAWLVLGHRELIQVTTDTALFARNVARWRLREQIPAEWPLWPMVGGGPAGASLLYTEGDEHRQRAGAVSRALAGIDPVEVRAQCEAYAEDLVESLAHRGHAELMAQYALLLPVMVMGWALGVPGDENEALVAAATDQLAGGDRALAGHQHLHRTMQALVRRVRERPGADVASRLAADPVGLSDEQLCQDLIVTIVAGHQTTAYWMGNAIHRMLIDPRHTDAFVRGRLAVSQALREVLWDDTPTAIFAGRWTSRPAHLGHVTIPAGDLVLLGLAAANRDPHLRPEPGVGMRGSRAYLSYSHGPHSCPDPARDAAETIVTAGIEVLLDRLPDLHLACPPEQVGWAPTVWMRGLESLPVDFTPTPPTIRYAGGTPWI